MALRLLYLIFLRLVGLLVLFGRSLASKDVEVLDLLALARTHPDRAVVWARLSRFYERCGAAGLPELERLASTVSAWWPEILAFIQTGITNAGSEGTNRVIKTVARDAYGFRNPVSQRLRTRCATTRRGRGCLDPA